MPVVRNGSLRVRLGFALGGLAVIAGVCAAFPREPAASVPVAASVAAPDSGTPASVAPVASASPVAPLRVPGGCGFTLGGSSYGGQAPVGRCTVVEIGDSIGSDLGWGLAREVAPNSGLTLVQLDKSSTGLAVPSFYDWPARLADALSRDHPQLVVICLGGNDQQGMVVDGKPVQFGTPAWRTAYVARVFALAAEATRAGAFVLWVGLPVMRQPTYDRGAREQDADFQAGIANLPRARYLSTRTLFALPDGSYATDGVVNGTRAGLREADGIHFSFIGENVAATFLLRQISLLYAVKLTPMQPAVIRPG